MNVRKQYDYAYQHVRIWTDGYGYHHGVWGRAGLVDFRAAIPVDIRRAAARSFNARRYAKHYWATDNACAKYDPTWLPF